MSRYGAWTVPGARETARLAWRARVDRRADIYARTRHEDDRAEIALAVACHRPWRSPRRPDPRRNYSRAHRRVCAGCQRMSRWLRVESFVAWERTMGRLHPNDCSAGYVERFVRFTRDPHGRRS